MITMRRSAVTGGTIAFVALAAGLVAPLGVAARSTATSPDATVVNRGVVQLETAGSAGISVRMAEDLTRLVNDGATRRLVPVVGTGALHNLIDLKHMRGI